MVSLHKDTTLPPTSTTSITSLGKTQAFLRKQQKAGSSKDTKTIQAPPGLTDDPWTVHDPWKSWQGARPSTDVPMPATRSMAEHLEEKMQQQVVASVKDSTGARLLVEIKHQQGKFETWFQEAGAANDLLQTQVQGLANQVSRNQKEAPGLSGQTQQQQQQIGIISADIQKGFTQIEALLSKKQRTSDE